MTFEIYVLETSYLTLLFISSFAYFNDIAYLQMTSQQENKLFRTVISRIKSILVLD